MRCPQCSEENSGSNRFCEECGHKLEYVVVCGGTQDDGEPCLEELKAKQKFCPNCGKKLDKRLVKITEQPASSDAPGTTSTCAVVDIQSGADPETPVREHMTGKVNVSASEDESVTNSATIHSLPQPSGTPKPEVADNTVAQRLSEQTKAPPPEEGLLTDSKIRHSIPQQATPLSDSESSDEFVDAEDGETKPDEADTTITQSLPKQTEARTQENISFSDNETIPSITIQTEASSDSDSIEEFEDAEDCETKSELVSCVNRNIIEEDSSNRKSDQPAESGASYHGHFDNNTATTSLNNKTFAGTTEVVDIQNGASTETPVREVVTENANVPASNDETVVNSATIQSIPQPRDTPKLHVTDTTATQSMPEQSGEGSHTESEIRPSIPPQAAAPSESKNKEGFEDADKDKTKRKLESSGNLNITMKEKCDSNGNTSEDIVETGDSNAEHIDNGTCTVRLNDGGPEALKALFISEKALARSDVISDENVTEMNKTPAVRELDTLIDVQPHTATEDIDDTLKKTAEENEQDTQLCEQNITDETIHTIDYSQTVVFNTVSVHDSQEKIAGFSITNRQTTPVFTHSSTQVDDVDPNMKRADIDEASEKINADLVSQRPSSLVFGSEKEVKDYQTKHTSELATKDTLFDNRTITSQSSTISNNAQPSSCSKTDGKNVEGPDNAVSDKGGAERGEETLSMRPSKHKTKTNTGQCPQTLSQQPHDDIKTETEYKTKGSKNAGEESKRKDTGQTKPITRPDSKKHRHSRSTSQSGSKREATILVHFHVLVSDELQLDVKDKRVALASDCFGEWNVLRIFPKSEPHTDMVCALEIPRQKIKGDNKMSYKYCIKSSGKDGNPKYKYEYYNSSRKNNRSLTILKKWQDKDEWHQYDGFIEREPGWFSKQMNKVYTTSDRIQHAKLSVEIFCTDIWQRMRGDMCIQEGLDQLDTLMICLKNVYFVDHFYWSYETDFKQEIGGILVNTIMGLLEQDLQGGSSETESQAEKRVVMLLATVYIVKSVGVDLTVKDAHLLCEALIIKPNLETKDCPELLLAEKYFKRKQQLSDAFISVASGMAKLSKNPSWLTIVPWIHFLSGMVKPYQAQEVDLKHDDTKPVWWGINGPLEDVTKLFKQHPDRWIIPVERMIGKLLPLFEMDYMLPRTLMTLVNVKTLHIAIQTGKIPTEISIATLIHFLKITCSRTYQIFETADEKAVKECAVSFSQQLQRQVYSDGDSKLSLEMCFRISSALLHESTKTNRGDTMCACAQIALHCLAVYIQSQESPDAKTLLSRVMNLTGMARQWLRRWCERWDIHYLEVNMKVWNGTFASVHLLSTQVRDLWNEQMADALMVTLSQQVVPYPRKTQSLIKLYCEKTNTFGPVVQECLSKISFQTLSNDYCYEYGRLNREGKKRFGDLLSTMFNNEWNKSVGNVDDTMKRSPRASSNEKILTHVLHWSPFLHFLKIRDEDQDKSQLFNSACVERMGEAVSVIKMVASSLLDGSITVGTLALISVPETCFDEIAEHVMQKKKLSSDFRNAKAIRNREMEAFKAQALHMTTLTSLCEHICNCQVDRRDVDQILEKLNNIGKHSMNEFCRPASVDKVADAAAFVTCLCGFPVAKEVTAVLAKIHACNQSNTFLHMWMEQGNEIENTTMTLEDVVAKVWIPVKKRWDTLSDTIMSGEIKFKDMERMIGRKRDDYAVMRTELWHMNVPREVANARLEQLKQYRYLETCVEGARVIIAIAIEYGLTGDFDNIKAIASHGQSDIQMKSFDESLMKTCKVLGGLTKANANCLEVFIKCSPLIEWLKESMHTTGLKELKVFVDLAFMSAGEEPINVKRVQCLHSSVTAYAPLIFDMNPSYDYMELLKRCQLVWDELKINPLIPTQLDDTYSQLQWFQDIKKAHGSVEVTSLVQAETINACGTYTVGKEALINSDDEKMAELESVLQLMVMDVEGKIPRRNYRFSQLQDLQSRLMLVAGKAEQGGEGVEKFTSVFDSIVRLSKVYLKLCSAGCVLFKEWTATFNCDPNPNRPVCIFLTFGDSTSQLKGRHSNDEDLKDMVPRLANFLETCYAAWLGHIRAKRRRYLHLNFFTVDQLVILQRELVKCGRQTEESPDDLVYPLLAAVKPDCTLADLETAMANAKTLVEKTEIEQDAETKGADEEEQKEAEDEMEDDRHTFIEEIVEAGYPRELAQQAVDHVEDFDVAEGIIWCEEHTEEGKASESDCGQDIDEQDDETCTREGAECLSFAGWTTDTQGSIQDIIASNIRNRTNAQAGAGFEPLRQELEELWSTFLGSISSSVSDYLSLEHLGIILSCLAIHNQVSVNRSLPPGYHQGEPNLLVCPSGDVLPMVLSLYMLNKDQPLPQSDEVLVCTEHTTVDEVDIFWMRALFGDIRKIYCLANVDLLSYNVSDTAERSLEEYRQSGTTAANYKLFVLCGSDNENRSRIVSALDKCRRAALPVNLQGIRIYLADKLRVTDQQPGCRFNPAAAVDFDNVRLVKSWRAGVGKTLYKTRTEASLEKLYRSGQRIGMVESESIQIHEEEENETIPLHEEGKSVSIPLNQGDEVADSGSISLHDEKESLSVTLYEEGESIRMSLHEVGESVSIPLQEKHSGVHHVMERLLQHSPPPGEHPPKIFHIDVAHEVQYGVDYLLFNLLVLGCLTDKRGYVWRRSWAQLYLVETMPLIVQTGNQKGGEMQYVHRMLDILPDVTCRSPLESIAVYMNDQGNHGNDQLFDEGQFRSSVFQRPYQYLRLHDLGQQLEAVNPETVAGDPLTCLQTLLRHCGVHDPSWAELHNFVWFLNTQLCDYETNNFVLGAADSLPGFPKFVLRFLINMSRDFSTRSLIISEQSPGALYGRQNPQQHQQQQAQEDNNTDLDLYQMRRTWESSPHPYLFINYDSTFTFLGFNINRKTGNMKDQVSGEILEAAILDKTLYDALVQHSVPIQENFDNLSRPDKILRLCSVMGIDMPHDPDDTYELTTDNVKKIMAVFMRFRCDIPVIIMGETGCGKTRLIKFMCSLQLPPGVEATNMILMKVHGGTTNEDIRRKVEEAERTAQTNLDKFGRRVFTVLFFDEANSTEAIGLIKEIMCDKSLQGKKLRLCENLKIVAACNPYRKHSEELIEKLEQAGLGYHVDAEATCDRLGRVPMRRLVYRVQPLPQSLLPLVWDFGQLNTRVEDLYIRQMVRRYVNDGVLPENMTGFIDVVSGILTASQEYMRSQKDECSFVSLRDVDRVLRVMSWFYQESQNGRTLYDLMDVQMYPESEGREDEECDTADEDEGGILKNVSPRPSNLTRSLVLALGVCYHASLRKREQYRSHVAQYFMTPCHLPGGADMIEREIICCQDVFLDSVQLEKNIARNMALKENVFMMTVCIELRIPLFLVGKPGSSKSLAKTIVSDAMQGNASREELFKELKQAQMVSFQCSPLATPDGIVGTFRQCAQFQKDKDLNTFVSIVVLDEVGLAEDSPRMPLKVAKGLGQMTSQRTVTKLYGMYEHLGWQKRVATKSR